MKRIYNFVILSVWAMLTVCCSSEEPILTPVKTGDEVKFALSLEDVTRTVYGGLEGDAGNKAYPIYWIEGDKVQIYSPNCLQGRNNAEYKVVLPENVSKPNYAKDLQKTGSYGIQWGEDAEADFYSLYPSGNYTLSVDGTKAEGINIAFNQNIYVNEDKASVSSFMEECIMYAKKGEVKKGNVVNLQYRPVTTTFMLTLNVPSASKDDFMIQSISLTASTNIAGDFSIKIADGTFGEWGANFSNSVTAQIFDRTTGGFFSLVHGNSITIPLFIAPVSDLNIEGWTVKVVTDKGTYKKKLVKEDTYDKTGKINAGEVHHITLPNLATEEEKEWDVTDWMVNIPRNVYLSEISIPGTWNSLNPDFQTDLTINDQYRKGVRAFHLDTRWQRKYVSISWSGIQYEYTLGVANGGNTDGGSTSKYDNDSPAFRTCLEEVISNLKTNEYMVLVCSFAQNSADATGTNGQWYSEISAICNEYTAVYDARNLTPNTLVGDVLGHVIVLVNMPSAISATTALPTDSKCLFTYLPSELKTDHFDGTDDNQDELWVYESSTKSKDTKIRIYNNQAQITSGKGDGSGYTTSSRGYAPSLTERTAILNKITTWSKENYSKTDYIHDQWIYLGLGGYKSSSSDAGAISGSYVAIETEYNSWINDKVDAMGVNNVPYYPVGIVLMNNKNGSTNYTNKTNAAGNAYNFASVVKNILLLNNKYRLQYDSSKPVDYNPNQLNASSYDANLTTGGNLISLDK